LRSFVQSRPRCAGRRTGRLPPTGDGPVGEGVDAPATGATG